MKHLFKTLLILTTLAAMSCTKDDIEMEGPVTSNNYNLIFGTRTFHPPCPDCLPVQLGTDEGAIVLRTSSGGSFQANNLRVELYGEITYRESETLQWKKMAVNTFVNTDSNGDFQTSLAVGTGQNRITEVSFDLHLKTKAGNKTYSKRLNLSNESVWSSLSGITNLVVDYQVTPFQRCREVKSGTKIITRSCSWAIDVDKDIVLQEQ